ncbi:unnamed protein product [Rhizoctonia solani]|uniref:Uncharacterized protein n=1 Tax=Rhizoctonia solani TaxID=456999 RepID=A0A8H2WBV8_9AGAM|nr:unnamed protein product [Rhizoctonia solani]
MPSFRKVVSRLLKAVAPFKMSSGNPNEAGGSPNPFIFPLYFADERTGVVVAAKSFTPQELLGRITEHSDAVDYIGKIHVTKILYCKEKQSPDHEFLVFKVEATDQKLSNYIKIDRCPQPKVKAEDANPDIVDTTPSQDDGQTPLLKGSSNPGILFSSSSSLQHSSISLGDQEARDMIHISGSQGVNSFINNRIEIAATTDVLTGPPGQRPTLEQLIVLAKFVSSCRPHYNVFGSQCFWYAYTIWMLLLTAFPETVIFDGELSSVVGKTKLLPLFAFHKQDIRSEGKNGSATKVTEIQRHAELAATYLNAWAAFEQDIPTMQAKHGAKARDAKIEKDRQRVEEGRQRVEEDRQRVEEGRQRVEEDRRQVQEERRRVEEERRQVEEERRIEKERRAEDAKVQQRIEQADDEIQRLQNVIAKLQAKSTAT